MSINPVRHSWSSKHPKRFPF